jgi:hypothetical protein
MRFGSVAFVFVARFRSVAGKHSQNVVKKITCNIRNTITQHYGCQLYSTGLLPRRLWRVTVSDPRGCTELKCDLERWVKKDVERGNFIAWYIYSRWCLRTQMLLLKVSKKK